jgi:hypothetical protein
LDLAGARPRGLNLYGTPVVRRGFGRYFRRRPEIFGAA